MFYQYTRTGAFFVIWLIIMMIVMIYKVISQCFIVKLSWTLSFNSIELHYVCPVFIQCCVISCPTLVNTLNIGAKHPFIILTAPHWEGELWSEVSQCSDTTILDDNLTELSPISISMQILDKRFVQEMLKLDQRPDYL